MNYINEILIKNKIHDDVNNLRFNFNDIGFINNKYFLCDIEEASLVISRKLIDDLKDDKIIYEDDIISLVELYYSDLLKEYICNEVGEYINNNFDGEFRGRYL